MARRAEKREHIERGVVEVVARKGLCGTTIQDIADEARVSPGLLYRYWKNRDDLAGEVYRAHYQALLERLAAQAAQETDSWERLCLMIRGFLEFADENPTILKFVLLSQHDLHRTVPPEQGLRALLTGLLRDGTAGGRIRTMSTDLAVQFILGIVLQPVVGALYGDLSSPLSAHYAEIVDALERVLLNSLGESA